MSKNELTLEQIEGALEEMADLMAVCDSQHQLELFSALYAKAYVLKLRLMPKEDKHVGH